ncbi:TM2 domain-containing protein [Flavimobilis soli]|uniref:TM2 domain-containing protein n=1 Tax=Flavimobilis soli TaxID=442709 RepID=A0A2A9ED96_9MICO|nr:TM2 domain-containing protein [Flavimobilis soli]PFG36190.1 TM2 domain-containing protein [Flavimobilis soli]
MTAPYQGAAASSEKLLLPAFLLAFFFGFLGAHRFYVGKIGTAVLMILTVGGFGIWTIVDLILMLVGKFSDKDGNVLTRWS